MRAATSEPPASGSGRDPGRSRRGNPVRRVAAELADTKAGDRAARVGLGARSVIYLVLGYLVARIAGGALGHASNRQPASGPGVAQAVAQQTGGHVVVFVLGIGLLLFALFSVLDAVLHHDHEDSGLARWTNRSVSVWTALLYAGLGTYCLLTAFAGGQQTAGKENRRQTQWSSHVLRWPGGRFWLFLLGAALVVVAGFLVSRAARGQFREQLAEETMSPAMRRLTLAAGVVGYLGRAGLFALVGGVIISAAVEDDPTRGKGVDGAARLLAENAAGAALLWVLAAALACYGGYMALEARYRTV